MRLVSLGDTAISLHILQYDGGTHDLEKVRPPVDSALIDNFESWVWVGGGVIWNSQNVQSAKILPKFITLNFRVNGDLECQH